MEFKRKGPDVAEIACQDGKRILFSYGEPVAVFFPDGGPGGRAFARVDEFVSRTTERHITQFVGSDTAASVFRMTRAEIRALTLTAC